MKVEVPNPETKPPSRKVLKAFKVEGEPELINSGQGRCFKAKDIVLKPLDMTEEEALWQAELMESLDSDKFRVARFVQALDGSWIVDGWTATYYVKGGEEKGRIAEKIDVSRAFHKSSSLVKRPNFLDTRHSPYSKADKVAWEGKDPTCHPKLNYLVSKLINVLKPIELPSQIIHGDLTDNILFANNFPPAVIDLAPYWRPADFAIAVIVADSIVWGGEDIAIYDLVKDVKSIDQLLIRAELRRIMELSFSYEQFGRDELHEVSAHEDIVNWLTTKS